MAAKGFLLNLTGKVDRNKGDTRRIDGINGRQST